MPFPKDPVRLAVHVGVYVVLYFLTALIFGQLLLWLGGYLAGNVGAVLFSAFCANWLALKIYENRHVIDLGLWWNRASGANLAWGVTGGAAGAVLVLLPPLAIGAAHLVRTPQSEVSAGSAIFVVALLAAGAAGEELFFRGYGFQLLVAEIGPYATIIPVGLIFALMHSANPHSSWPGIANTAGFGILFGYAYVRSRDLWLPVGMHFGWNLTLSLFGATLSGLRIGTTGHEMSWTAGGLWSGGAYGPEASVLTSAAVALLFVYVWKAPVRRQFSPLTGPPAENAICDPSASLPPSLPS